MKAATRDFLISICMIALIFGAMALANDANAAEADQSGMTISLSKEESDMCAAEGGCIVMTQKTAEAIVEYVKAMQENKESCGKRI